MMVKAVLREIYYQVQRCYDAVRGVDFITRLDNRETGISRDRGTCYMATSVLFCRVIRNYLEKSGGGVQDALLDVGCGKGRMLEFFTKFGFGTVDGVEYF